MARAAGYIRNCAPAMSHGARVRSPRRQCAYARFEHLEVGHVGPQGLRDASESHFVVWRKSRGRRRERLVAESPGRGRAEAALRKLDSGSLSPSRVRLP